MSEPQRVDLADGLEPLAALGLGGLLLGAGLTALLVSVVAVALVGRLSSSLNGFTGALPNTGLLDVPAATVAPGVPPDQLAEMRQVAARSACHLPWSVLAGVASVESSFGRHMGPSSAGAIGYGQFMPATWAAYGAGGNPMDFRDALPAMDRFLCAMAAEFGRGRSADDSLARALFYYNHARTVPFDAQDGYVRTVLERAAALAAPPHDRAQQALVADWAARPALNQYACANYTTLAACQQWRAAACSAAALHWLLGAYGLRLPGIDTAIGLIGPGTGISTTLGLLDSTGGRLATAISGTGLVARRARLTSSNELRAWIATGPVLLDGHRWFGAGHWFVAIASDAGGVFIRDSSGYDVPYLNWSRLSGEVGWSGWTVGVQPTSGGAAG